MKKINKIAALLLAVASLSLIATYFVPVWRIDLFAPQYPEGLTMQIWLYKLSGDVDIINGLNHYIGMRHISAEMFPEFTYLNYIVAFYIILGLVTAITRRRKLLFIYLCLSVIGGLLAIYDFYSWGYDYGHNLNPEAPIKVPGLAYQPPVIGHKRLLNFDAYSTPDIGGWIVIAAGVIAFTIWFIAWYKERKFRHTRPSMMIIMVLALLIASCSAQPQKISIGKDICYTCKMGFTNKKFGGEVLTNKGKVFLFDDVICMTRFLKSGSLNEKDIAQLLILDYNQEDHFIISDKASFVISTSIKTPMNSNAAAFASQQEAETFNKNTGGQIMQWKEVYEKIQ